MKTYFPEDSSIKALLVKHFKEITEKTNYWNLFSIKWKNNSIGFFSLSSFDSWSLKDFSKHPADPSFAFPCQRKMVEMEMVENGGNGNGGKWWKWKWWKMVEKENGGNGGRLHRGPAPGAASSPSSLFPLPPQLGAAVCCWDGRICRKTKHKFKTALIYIFLKGPFVGVFFW